MKFAVDLRLAEPAHKRARHFQVVIAAPDGLSAMKEAQRLHQGPGLIVSVHGTTPLPLDDETPVIAVAQVAAPVPETIVATVYEPPPLTEADLAGVSENIRPPAEDEDDYVPSVMRIHTTIDEPVTFEQIGTHDVMPKRKGWPKGKPRGPRKVKVA